MRLLQSRLDLAQQQQDIRRQAQAEAQQVCSAQAGEAESEYMLASSPRVLGGDTGDVRDMCLCVCEKEVPVQVLLRVLALGGCSHAALAGTMVSK